jgi:hypothetical protein
MADAGEDPPQLRMLVLGHGGMGKSMLIGAITETFKVLGAEGKLAKGENISFVGWDPIQ